MKKFFKTCILFFKTSPLKRWDIIMRMSILGLLSAFMIWGIIYEVFAHHLSVLAFTPTTLVIIVAAIWMINPPVFEAWLQSNSLDDTKK
ncbi:MAG TPA: hypothetical protein VFD16_02615 [Candidatus Saccharimonadales bacterium]|nr:hypothetical protein [Candidatus Saccharimonadales bacterium]